MDAVPGSGVRPLTDREFHSFQELVYREAGIHLSEAKRSLLVGRLTRRVKALSLRSFSEYYEHVSHSADELVQMLDAISTNETHFFREPQHFDFIERRVIPEWKAQAEAGLRARSVRLWSAGCSTGEEPYSLAMLLLDRLPPADGWSVSIAATDLSTRVLARAEEALWPIQKANEIPPHFLKQYMLRGTGTKQGLMKACPELRAVIHFSRLNLNEAAFPPGGPFDLVFCRNVLIYFSRESRSAVAARLLSQLQPGGYLFLGHAETLNQVCAGAACVIPTVYRHAEPARSAAPRGK